MEYLLHILILITFYVMLAQSLSLVAGFGGMISLSHAGFYGVGAYTTAILSVNLGWSFMATLPIAMILTGMLALIVSLIALRTVEDYFIICTLGIQIIIFSLMNNWMELTRGPLGIPGIPTLSIFGYEFNDKLPFLILSMGMATLTFYLLNNLTSSRFGKVLIAIKEDEIFIQSLGKPVYKFKVITFTIGAMVASIPGVLYAHYISFIDPSSFTVLESIFILSIVIIGGMQNLLGSIAAAAFLIFLPEALRFIGMPSNIAANMRQIIYGILLIISVTMKFNFLNQKWNLHA